MLWWTAECIRSGWCSRRARPVTTRGQPAAGAVARHPRRVRSPAHPSAGRQGLTRPTATPLPGGHCGVAGSATRFPSIVTRSNTDRPRAQLLNLGIVALLRARSVASSVRSSGRRSRTSAYSSLRAAFISAITARSSVASVNAIRNTGAVPPWRCTGSTSRRTSRATFGRAGSRQTDCCRYSAPSERSLCQTCTRNDPAALAVDTLITGQFSVDDAITTGRRYARDVGRSPGRVLGFVP